MKKTETFLDGAKETKKPKNTYILREPISLPKSVLSQKIQTWNKLVCKFRRD